MEIQLCPCGFLYWRCAWRFPSCDGHLWHFASWCNFGCSPFLFGNGINTRPWCQSQKANLPEPIQKKREISEDPSQKEAENSGVSGPKDSEVNEKEPASGSKGPTLEEKQQMAKSKQREKEDEFTESDNEKARFGTNMNKHCFYRFLFCWIHVLGEFYLIKHMAYHWHFVVTWY